MPEDGRPDPDALLAIAAGEGRGRLKVFLGSAPGVGKTWEMLVQAKGQLAKGVDVLAGVIETHGRRETEREAVGIPLLPYRNVPYRGRVLQEFDLEAALARRPGLLLVDELAHTNAPGSRHAKRWEDVEALLAAGIDVWATLNVQHLESLNEDVARITGIRVSETLPDRVLEAADEIELIDVTPAELRTRLSEGKIYRPDNAGRALDGFFREGNLAALREIALRRAAAHVDDDVRDWMRRAGVAGPWPAGDRVMALVGPDKGSEGVVRHAKRLAEALRAPWIALHIERDNTVAAARPALELAAQLGATVATRVGSDMVRETVAFAGDSNVTHLVVGRTASPWWRRLTGRVLSVQLLRRAPHFVLHVIPLPGGKSPRRPQAPAGWMAWGISAALVVGVTLFGELVGSNLPGQALGMAYLAAVVVGASVGGVRPALAVAAGGFLAWDYFFIPPIGSITIGSVQESMALLLFALVAVVSGSLAGRVRAAGRAAQARIDGLRRIAAFSRSLGQAATERELLAELARQAAAIAGRAMVLAPVGGGADPLLDIRASEPEADTMDEGSWAAARWAWVKQDLAGQGTGTLPSAQWRFMPLRTIRAQLGVLGVRSAAKLNEPEVQALAALSDQAAVAWERVRLAVDSARTAAMEETQRLRTALLASLGHDLRTPLTAISGAAGTVRSNWAQLDPATRDDLLESIEQDVARMARFLTNITELTRLETGQINPNIVPVSVAEAVEAASSRLQGTPFVAVNIAEPEPVALADPVMLEQVLVNVLENAAKYAPLNSLIQVRGWREGGEVVLTVADEGVGIAADDLAHVFDSFFRARRGDRVAPGTGLGLAISRGLIEAMGGRITAASPRPDLPRDGAPGTVVTIHLPATNLAAA